MSEYPLPLPFIESMRPLLSGEMDAFLASYQQPAQRGVRFRDARRPLPANSLLGDIPYARNACYLSLDSNAGAIPLHEAGAYYLQEPSAMAAAAALRPQDGERVLDLCAGSGCIGLAVAKNVPGSHVVLGEIDEGALRICRQNIRRTGLSGQAVSMQLNALEKAPKRLGEFDCIVSNPPYIPDGDIAGLDPSVRDYEPHLALRGGADGLDFYRAICENWREVLRPGGRLYFEVGIGQADDVLRIMRAVGFGDIEVLPDLNGIPRVVWGILHTEI